VNSVCRDALAAHEQRLSASEKHTSAENTLLMARIEALEQKSTAKVTSPTLAPRPAVPDALLIEETNKLNRRIEQLTHEQHTQAERVQKCTQFIDLLSLFNERIF
jgi:hypothetical protein